MAAPDRIPPPEGAAVSSTSDRCTPSGGTVSTAVKQIQLSHRVDGSPRAAGFTLYLRLRSNIHVEIP